MRYQGTNPALGNVDGLSALVSVGKFFDVLMVNGSLTNVDGLSAPSHRSARSVDHSRRCEGLTNVDGLRSLISARTGRTLSIGRQNGSQLTNIDGLSGFIHRRHDVDCRSDQTKL